MPLGTISRILIIIVVGAAASDAVTWLQNHLACSQDRAVQVGQLLCDAGFFKCVIGIISSRYCITVLPAQIHLYSFPALSFRRHVVDLEKKFAMETLYFRFYDVPTDEELRRLVCDEWVAACVKTMDVEQKNAEWTLERDLANSAMEAKAWSRIVPGQELKSYKVCIRSKARMADLVKLLHDEMTERHGEWNSQYLKGKVLYKLDEDTNVQYWSYNPGTLLKKRDFVVVRRRIVNDDGSVILCDRSVDTGLRPEASGYVEMVQRHCFL